MAEMGSSGADSDSDRVQKALAGYQAAINLWTYQGEQWWGRFNVMLFANSIVLAAVTLVLTSRGKDTAWMPLLPGLSVALSAGGLALCLLWLMLIKREIVYADYYLWSARELEHKHLRDIVITVSRGGDLADGNCVDIATGDGKHMTLSMAGLAHFRARSVAVAVVYLFLGLYAIILLLALGALLCTVCGCLRG